MKLIRLLPLLGLFLLPAGTALAEYVEGTQYKRLAAPVPTVDASKVEVVELFWYGCPHCYRLCAGAGHISTLMGVSCQGLLHC